jgi:hypothetical protein
MRRRRASRKTEYRIARTIALVLVVGLALTTTASLI